MQSTINGLPAIEDALDRTAAKSQADALLQKARRAKADFLRAMAVHGGTT